MVKYRNLAFEFYYTKDGGRNIVDKFIVTKRLIAKK